MKRGSWLFGNVPAPEAGEAPVDFPANWWRGARAIGGILRVSPSTVTFYPNKVESWFGGTGFTETTGTLRLEGSTTPTSKVGLRTPAGKTYWLRLSEPERLRALLDRGSSG